jgi:uncharacterized protein YggE
MNAYDAYIAKFSYSKIIELQKENRIKAIKVAKEKAEYLLAAISQTCGAPIQIIESENFAEGENNYYGQPRVMRNVVQSYNIVESDNEGSIEFKKIKVRNAFTVRFEIVKK